MVSRLFTDEAEDNNINIASLYYYTRMDTPFQPDQWTPSRTVEVWEHQLDTADLTKLISRLNLDTQAIAQHPYDPTSWLARGKTLESLYYPELVVGDAHKAILLCRSALDKLRSSSQFRLGSRSGFWMVDPDMANSDRRDQVDALRDRINDWQRQANELLARSLDWPEQDKGRCVLQAYPWMRDEHLWRSDEMINFLNEQFQDPKKRAKNTEPGCVLRRYAFGEGVGARDGADLLGVFAARGIQKDETIVIDKSNVWGCNGPGQNGTTENLFGGVGCSDPIHPNSPCDDSSDDLRWIRDRCGKQAADAILKCRFLLTAVRAGVDHPLDHPALAGLTPTYREGELRDYSVESDIAILNEALQQFGVDVFAESNWDTWTFFVLMARADNNNWSDPVSSCLSSLFSLFNHSCDSNVDWIIPMDHQTMRMKTNRDIEMGEQLFICYDGFMEDQPLEVRRERFWRWLDGPCQCTKCLAEESEYSGSECTAPSCDASNVPFQWDTDEKPVLPEDDIDLRYILERYED